MERVKKGEIYWYINFEDSEWMVDYCEEGLRCINDNDYTLGNYFADKESAEAMARKLRAVLKGADVIEMPSEEEIDTESKKYEYPPLFKAALTTPTTKVVGF